MMACCSAEVNEILHVNVIFGAEAGRTVVNFTILRTGTGLSAAVGLQRLQGT